MPQTNQNAAWTDGSQLDATRLLLGLMQRDAELKSNPRVKEFLLKHAPSFDALASQRLDARADFETIETIGAGKASDVKLVRHTATGEAFALKMISKAEALLKSDPACVMVERDVMVAARDAGLRNLARLESAFQDDNFLYLVMKYEAGGDLFQVLETQPVLSAQETQLYLAEVALALHTLHQLGFAHRDVKPENLLIGKDGHVVLGDFGSAVRLGACRATSASVGTSDYISPEVITDAGSPSAGSVSAGDDWWSFGVLAYEMLCGCMPFSGTTEDNILSNILNFDSTFEVPGDVALPAEALGLIAATLATPDRRAGFEAIKGCAFFAGMDWGKLGAATPGFVPSLDSDIDTKYFDVEEIKTTNTKPLLSSFAMVQMAAPYAHGLTQLPFVGWSSSRSAAANAVVPPPVAPRKKKASLRRSTHMLAEAREATAPVAPSLPAAPLAPAVEEAAPPRARQPELKELKEAKVDVIVKHPAPLLKRLASEPRVLACHGENTGVEQTVAKLNTSTLQQTEAPSSEATPAWKLAMRESKRAREVLEEQRAREADLDYQLKDLPEWKKTLVVRRMQQASKKGATMKTVVSKLTPLKKRKAAQLGLERSTSPASIVLNHSG